MNLIYISIYTYLNIPGIIKSGVKGTAHTASAYNTAQAFTVKCHVLHTKSFALVILFERSLHQQYFRQVTSEEI